MSDTGDTQPEATQSEAAHPDQPSAPAAPAGRTVPSTRVSSVWTILAVGLVFLIALLIFIFQNLNDVRVTFIVFHGSVPLALSLLGSAIVGALVVMAVGVARMIQLRRAARRHRDAAVAATKSTPPS